VSGMRGDGSAGGQRRDGVVSVLRDASGECAANVGDGDDLSGVAVAVSHCAARCGHCVQQLDPYALVCAEQSEATGEPGAAFRRLHAVLDV